MLSILAMSRAGEMTGEMTGEMAGEMAGEMMAAARQLRRAFNGVCTAVRVHGCDVPQAHANTIRLHVARAQHAAEDLRDAAGVPGCTSAAEQSAKVLRQSATVSLYLLEVVAERLRQQLQFQLHSASREAGLRLHAAILFALVAAGNALPAFCKSLRRP